MADYSQLKQVQQWIGTQGMDLGYFSNFQTIQYLTGFGSDPIERVLALFVFPDADPFLFCPALEVEAVKDTGWPYGVYGYLDHENAYAMIADQIKARTSSPAKWAIEMGNLTIERFNKMHEQFPDAMFDLDATDYIANLRVIKTPHEIELLNAAGAEADYAFEIGFKAVAAGVPEQRVAAELQYALMKRGVMNMSFDTLIQAGAHAAEPHGATGANKIENNELILFDLGTVHEGYISDASRTVALGKLSDKQADIYKVCLEAQLAAMDAAKPGITAAQLDKVARDIISKAGYGEYFIHRLGHGMGQSEHEFPSIMEGNDLVLKEGMCFSIEPGIYIPDVAGVRIEDCVHITADGCEPFTHTSKDLTYVG
ncbi:M24 family metallopeptidase [Furfurilactobacillus milii]|uniref:M24 family metallopeptidase n=1 Tax=Furfurilactobacillus milii TaxID=2888272 RepID=A0A6N9I4W1_9LACO|nr:Xaa-Pro peptidase family protein [Furfurilactobacillus milii]MYV18015.1 M24 family metallopeptidase [Furfurilactobacillus milii]